MPRVRLVLLIQFLSLALALANAQGGVTFGSINVGTAALTQTVTYTFLSATTLSAVNISTTGAAGLDYTDGGGSTCTAGSAYHAGDSCTVTVAFTPLAPGLRLGAVILFAQGSRLPLVTYYLNGVGQSGAVTIDPGTQSTIAMLNNNGQGYGSAVDGAGNVYVVDHANSQVIELSAGTFAQSTVVAFGSGLGLLSPTAAALDGAGNLYISDTGNGRVVMVPNEQSGLNSADMTQVSISGLSSPRGLAVDGGGNLYVSDSADGVFEVPAGGGTPITVASGLTSPHALAVDARGNVYVVTNNSVTEYQPPFPGTATQVVSGFNNPHGIAVDASGVLYIADTGNSQIVWVAPGGASQSIATGIRSPQGIAVDAAGNVYVTSQSGSVIEINRTQAVALTFAGTFVGSTSTPQTLTVSDAGNQPLTISNVAAPTNFTVVTSGGADCYSSTQTSLTQLSSAGQCLIAVAAAPTISGSLTGTLTLTDNALNNSASTQTVQLSSAGLQLAQTITFATIPTQVYGAAPFALGASASSGLPVIYTVSAGPASVNGNTLTITGAGSVTVQASQPGNAQYAAAAAVSQTFAVSPAATSVSWSNPAAITYGTALGAAQLDATATPVSAGAYAYTPAAGTVLGAGSQTLSVQFTPSDSNYAPSTGSVILQVNPAPTTVVWSNPAAIGYGTPLSSLQLNATATPVSAGTYLYNPPAGTVLNQGSQALSVQFTPTSSNYASSNGSATVQVNQGSQTITFPTIPTQMFGAGAVTLNATASSGLPVSYK